LPGFRNLFFATLGSSFGTLLAAVALAIDVKDKTSSSPYSGVWVAAVLIVEFLPTIIVGLLLGPLLDRLERRSLMIAADALRVGVFVALPFAPDAATVVALAFVAGLATGFFRPAVYAGVPNLVPEEDLPAANALLQTVENLSWAIGPLVGGILTAAAGPSAAYLINAVSFVVSMLLVLRIPPRLLQSERALSRGHWNDLADGFKAALRSRRSRWGRRPSRRSSSPRTRSPPATSATGSSTRRSAAASCWAASRARRRSPAGGSRRSTGAASRWWASATSARA
jgi:MFS family permease